MGEVTQSPEGIRVSELLFEDDLAGKSLSQTALAWDSELLRKLCPDIGNRSDFHIACF